MGFQVRLMVSISEAGSVLLEYWIEREADEITQRARETGRGEDGNVEKWMRENNVEEHPISGMLENVLQEAIFEDQV